MLNWQKNLFFLHCCSPSLEIIQKMLFQVGIFSTKMLTNLCMYNENQFNRGRQAFRLFSQLS